MPERWYTASPAGGTLAAVTMKEGRVLVVDDEPMVRETLGQMLTDEGYVVDLAVDGESALDRVHSARPDAILLDLMMPGMNGRQFLQALRDEPAYESVPVLIMTAVHGLEVNLATLGASEVVEKPFNIEELLNKVALAVYRSRDAHKTISQPLPMVHVPPPTAQDSDRGVVLIVEHDRGRLQQLDLLLSARGYTVVSMTRALVQLSRLARALRPRAILLDLLSEGVNDVVRELRAEKELDEIPLLVFARDGAHASSPIEALAPAADADLVSFVERAH
jgi:DNA-binding response OmpR family regulator